MRSHRAIRTSTLLLALLALLASGLVQAQKIKVVLATPAEAEQNTANLEVIIDGENFDAGTTFTFLVSGSRNNTGGITVKNNQNVFINPGQMKTYIDVDEFAVLGDFDIQATTSRGRRGKGNTLFRVLQQGSSGGGGGGPTDRPGDVSVYATFDDDTGDAIVSDGGGGYLDEVDGAWLISGMNGNFVAGEFDSKKFNPAKRTLQFKSDCGGIDDVVCDPAAGREVEQFWTAWAFDADGNPVGDWRLQWLEMTAGQVTRVSVLFDLGHVRAGKGPTRSRDVAFGNANGQNIGCTADATGAGPAWISCNSEDAYGCDSWTLSSFDLSGGSDDAQACLKREEFPDQTIDAPFAVEIIAVP